MLRYALRRLAVQLRTQSGDAPRFEVVSSISGVWHYRIRATNGRVMSTSETYDSRSNAIRAAISAAYPIPGSTVIVVPFVWTTL